MKSPFWRGIVSGLIAGSVFAAVTETAFFSRISTVSIGISQALLFMSGRSAVSLPGYLFGVVGHILTSSFFGALYVYFFRPGSWLLKGFLWGMALYVINFGLIDPFLRITPPLWKLSFSTLATFFVAHSAFGIVLAYVVELLGGPAVDLEEARLG